MIYDDDAKRTPRADIFQDMDALRIHTVPCGGASAGSAGPLGVALARGRVTEQEASAPGGHNSLQQPEPTAASAVAWPASRVFSEQAAALYQERVSALRQYIEARGAHALGSLGTAPQSIAEDDSSEDVPSNGSASRANTFYGPKVLDTAYCHPVSRCCMHSHACFKSTCASHA